MKQSKGLGDIVEDVIKTIAPKLAEKKKDCVKCKKRKSRLNKFPNNINGIFK